MSPGPRLRLLDGERIFVVDALLTPDECRLWLQRGQGLGYEEAPVTTAFGPKMMTEVRNNRRAMADRPDWADELWQRLQPLLPPMLASLRPTRLNERLRFYRYELGHRFKWHHDGAWHDHQTGERSLYTVLVYLDEPAAGGETHTRGPDLRICPQPGLALLFEHSVLHCGQPVKAGCKHVLRSDLMVDLAALQA